MIPFPNPLLLSHVALVLMPMLSLSEGFTISQFSSIGTPSFTWKQHNIHDGERLQLNCYSLLSSRLQLSNKDGQESSVLDVGELGSSLVIRTQSALKPIEQAIDDVTGGWGLSYADLSPESEMTAVGQAFLATNIAYTAAGLFLSTNGDFLLGTLTELASIVSFIYHYAQLQASDNRIDGSSVRLALLIDYICASTAILVGLVYIFLDQQLPPIEGIVAGGAGIACLLLCWVWEYGTPYIILHSLWHLLSAYTAFVIGNSHLAV